jgi:ribose transport system ATP-binding protein
MNVPLFEIRGIGKTFGGVRALHNVSLNLRRGEVLAVIGENGAGKSTLMKILAGVQPPTTGEMFLNGKKVQFSSVDEALRSGISLIHQELNLAENLDVGANIYLGREPSRWGWINHIAIERDANRLLSIVGLDVAPTSIVRSLTIGKQQLVEIAKALSTDARILIMDEPTSSLSQKESETLFRVVRELRSQGVSIIYISHRLGEVQSLADRVIVLRDGELVGELLRENIGHDTMVRMMVGRDPSPFYRRAEPGRIETLLAVENLRTHGYPNHSLSFEVRCGEIVGIAGLVGAGRTELLTTLFGITPSIGGSIRVGASRLRPRCPNEAIEAGIMLVPEDRRHAGLLPSMNVKHNLSLARLTRDQKYGFLNRRAEERICAEMIRRLRIKLSSDRQLVRLLSGGNQQKVVLGKCLAMNPKLLLLDEPTRGIDVQAKDEIYSIVRELADRGVAILFASSEMEEVMGLAERVLVMHEGRITGELADDQLSEQAIMRLATNTLETMSR